MVHLPHQGKLRRDVKEEALDDGDAAARAEASPFHKRSRLALQVGSLSFLLLRCSSRFSRRKFRIQEEFDLFSLLLFLVLLLMSNLLLERSIIL
jgi:hypothetical protein